MKLKFSLIVLFLATLLCHSQDSKIKNSQLKEVKIEAFYPNGISLFPNPSSNEVTLEFKFKISNLKMEVINIKGHLMVENEAKNTFREKIDISTFPHGVYYIRVYSETVEDFLKFVKK